MTRPQASLSSQLRLDCGAMGGPKRRVWHKIYWGIDEETLEVQAVEIPGSHIGDTPILPDLRDQIPQHQEFSSVTADGAYDTRKCHDAIADRGAHAVIPPRRTRSRGRRSQPEPWRETRPCARRNTWGARSGEPFRTIASRCPAGQRMERMKLLDQQLMARHFDRRIAELQVRIAVLNGYTALGIPVTEALG